MTILPPSTVKWYVLSSFPFCNMWSIRESETESCIILMMGLAPYSFCFIAPSKT